MDRSAVLKLIAEKDAMVAEIDSLLVALDEQGVGMNRTLTTFDGYPRDDVDIPLIRSQRQKVIMLENDLKQIMEKIKVGLETVLAAPAATEEPPLEPFCYVAEVGAGSLLEPQDKIIEFGSINQHNHNALRGLPTQLNKSPLRVTVLRGEEKVKLELHPNGKLGARVLPL